MKSLRTHVSHWPSLSSETNVLWGQIALYMTSGFNTSGIFSSNLLGISFENNGSWEKSASIQNRIRFLIMTSPIQRIFLIFVRIFIKDMRIIKTSHIWWNIMRNVIRIRFIRNFCPTMILTFISWTCINCAAPVIFWIRGPPAFPSNITRCMSLFWLEFSFRVMLG